MALQALVPKALLVLAKHLGDGDEVNENAWRAAVRIFEHQFGRAADVVEEEPDPATLDPFQVAAMTPLERARLVARVVKHYPQFGSARAGSLAKR